MGNVFSKNWENLDWSDWIPLDGGYKEFEYITTDPGVYRIRACELDFLIYIGQTGRNLRSRLYSLRRGIFGTNMPYNDPHTAAPNLWAWHQEELFYYEGSVAAVNFSKANRQALEDFFLWKHRVCTGKSTLCNYGRFHSCYVKSKNRSTGFRGYKLSPNERNPSGGPNTKPLFLYGRPDDRDWMKLSWSPTFPLKKFFLQEIPRCKCLYKIINTNTKQILYIGETKNLRNRFRSHLSKNLNGQPIEISYTTLSEDLLDYQRRESEVDSFSI